MINKAVFCQFLCVVDVSTVQNQRGGHQFLHGRPRGHTEFFPLGDEQQGVGVDHCVINVFRIMDGIALGQPVFVKAIQPDGNILLGWAGEEFYRGVILRDVCTPSGQPLADGEYEAKIRSAASPALCLAKTQPDGTVALVFPTPVRAPAPGQSAVLYRGDVVMGGGFIQSILP